MGASGDRRLKGAFQGVRQRVDGWRAGCVRGADAEVGDSLREVVLVVQLRNDDLGCAGQCGSRCRARSTVMHDGRDPIVDNSTRTSTAFRDRCRW
jgi:hypothetical protein